MHAVKLIVLCPIKIDRLTLSAIDVIIPACCGAVYISSSGYAEIIQLAYVLNC